MSVDWGDGGVIEWEIRYKFSDFWMYEFNMIFIDYFDILYLPIKLYKS